MALIECPECGHEVSSAATACPNCGHPLQSAATVPEQDSPDAIGSPVAAYGGVRVLRFGLSGTVAGFWWATAALYAIAALLFFATWGLWIAFRDGNASLVELVDLDNTSFGFGAFALLVSWISGILFIIWFFQAYTSAESRGASGRTWGAGWTIGAWFIPFANLVIPKLVMNEVDRMSNPLAGEAPTDERWKKMPRIVASDVWWITLVLGWVAYWIGNLVYFDGVTYEANETGTGYLVLSLAHLVLGIAAALVGVVAFLIGRRLRGPTSTTT